MKTYNTKKKITILVLSLAAVILAGGLWVYMDSLGNVEPPSGIAENPGEQDTGIKVQDIHIPDGVTQSRQNSGTDSADPATPDDVIITDTPPVTGSGTSGQDKPSDGKPKTASEATPPTTPEPVPVEEHENTGNDDPNTPPSSAPVPAKPETNTPQSGDKKDGAIYVPGFGWIEDNGKDNSQGSAPNAGTGEKVGNM